MTCHNGKLEIFVSPSTNTDCLCGQSTAKHYSTQSLDECGLIKVILQGKLFQRCTHLLYLSGLSLAGDVDTRRMSKPDMGSNFTHKKSMKYSGHRKLLCDFLKLSKFNAFNLLGY